MHEYITLHAAASAEEFSANYHEFLETIKPADGFLKFSFDGKTKTHDGWMAEGSAREDDQDTDQGGKRSYNHFYDPLSETGLSDYPPDIRTSLMGRNSFVWASVFNSPGLNFTALPGHNVNTINEWSWQNARNFQRLGMSDPNPTVRDENIAKLFRALGDVVHLLQDTLT